MGINRVDFGDKTLMDITDSTVTKNNLLSGAKAYGANGEPVTGNLIVNQVLDTLDSSSTKDALSANQGKKLKTLVDKKQDKLTAGDNITIKNGVISAPTKVIKSYNIEITKDAVTSIDVSGITKDSIVTVYLDGLLLTKNVHYTLATNKILFDYTVKRGSLFTVLLG